MDWSTVVDVVIAVRDVSTGIVTVIDSHSDNKPTANNVQEERVYAVSELGVQLDAFDQIIISARARSDSGSDDLCIGLIDVGGAVDPIEIVFQGKTCPEDFDDDGMVGSADLAQLMGAWGPCP